MRRLRTAATIAALASVFVGTAPVAAVATPPSASRTAGVCSTGWGSLPKSAADTNTAPLTNIRTGRHNCYDRMVFDVPTATGAVGYHVGYVGSFHQDGSGRLIPVGGGAILEIFVNAPSYDSDYRPTYAAKAAKPLPGVKLTGYRTFRDTKFGASYEGQTQVGLGVRARLPFRALQLDSRLIVDVAHTW
ncbi:AMIN-like domain-containing (lipo)protein [Streptomyces wuyuanensis]|uniref:AMIN-like domain-containing (lipo)protein n=1 Tax=Streptomyces wuyuanensis TaxID=1196353 RepID=UPI00343A3B4B